MNSLKYVKLGELVENLDNRRIPLSSSQRASLAKIYPYYGAQGVIDYVDKYIFDGEFILVAEDGENLKSQKQKVCQVVTGKFWVNNHAHIIRASGENDTRYLAYLLNLIDFKPYITGSAQPKLTKENLSLIKLSVHSPAEQRNIAAVLSALDAKIELNNRMNAELEGMAKLLYDYWFVQYDFPISEAQAKALGRPALTGHPYRASGAPMVFDPQLKREIPKGWEVGSLADLGTIVGGSTPSTKDASYFTTEGIPWITPKDLSRNTGNKFITRGETDLSEKGVKAASLTILPAGSVLMSSRAPVGYTAINRIPVTTNQGFKSFVASKAYPVEFIYYTLNHLMRVIEQNASGSTFKEVSASTLKTISTILPDAAVLEAFQKTVSPLFQQQDNLEQQNQELARLRDWLLPMLMNGQVRVE